MAAPLFPYSNSANTIFGARNSCLRVCVCVCVCVNEWKARMILYDIWWLRRLIRRLCAHSVDYLSNHLTDRLVPQSMSHENVTVAPNNCLLSGTSRYQKSRKYSRSHWPLCGWCYLFTFFNLCLFFLSVVKTRICSFIFSLSADKGVPFILQHLNLTHKRDQDGVKINHNVTYLGQMSCRSNGSTVIIRTLTHRHTYQTDCNIWPPGGR